MEKKKAILSFWVPIAAVASSMVRKAKKLPKNLPNTSTKNTPKRNNTPFKTSITIVHLEKKAYRLKIHQIKAR